MWEPSAFAEAWWWSYESSEDGRQAAPPSELADLAKENNVNGLENEFDKADALAQTLEGV